MRRTFTVIALVLATAGPAAAQSTSSQGQSNCPIARTTLLGAAVGFGVIMWDGVKAVGGLLVVAYADIVHEGLLRLGF